MSTDDTNAARRGSGSNDLLGPDWPEPDHWMRNGYVRFEPHHDAVACYTHDQVRAIVAAERERWMAAATAASQELCHCAPWSAGGQAFAALRALIDGPNAKFT